MKRAFISLTIAASTLTLTTAPALARDNVPELFAAAYKSWDDYSPLSKTLSCDEALAQRWDKFSGTGYEYQALDAKYVNGAATAAMCALRRGVLTSLALDRLTELRKQGVVKQKGRAAAIQEASEWPGTKMPLNMYENYMKKVSCSATTPIIQTTSSGPFEQRVDIKCTAPHGPVTVDLKTLHVRVNGQDVWNGKYDTFLGRSLSKSLGEKS